MAVGVRCGVGTVHHRLRTAKLSISYSDLSILERLLSISHSLLSILERFISVSYSVLSILERLISVSYSSLSVLERLLSISFSRKHTGRARRGEALRFRPTEAEVASTFQKGQAVVGALWEWAACSEKDGRLFFGCWGTWVGHGGTEGHGSLRSHRLRVSCSTQSSSALHSR